MQSFNFTGNHCAKIVRVILALYSNLLPTCYGPVLDSMIVRLITCVIVRIAKLAKLILPSSSNYHWLKAESPKITVLWVLEKIANDSCKIQLSLKALP